MTTSHRAALFETLRQLRIETTTIEHPAVFSVEESRELDCQIPGGHTKNLFLKDAKGRLFLVIAHSETVVDLKGLPQRIGSARLSFGKADLLEAVLGVTPGSVTAFALMNDSNDHQVQAIFDEALMNFETINCHPMTNTATTSIAREDLFKFFRHTDHEPKVLNLEKHDAPPS